MSIQEHLNKIRNAVYGREVRESIAKGIETAYDDASENGNANMEVKIARGTNPNLNSRLNKMEEDGRETEQEVKIARGTHPNLRSRLEEVDNKQQQTTAQLAQKVQKGNASVHDINKSLGKFDQTYMSEEFLEQMRGNAPINATPENQSLTSVKYADKSLLPQHADFVSLSSNLYDESKNTLNTIISEGGTLTGDNESYHVSDFILVKPNTEYFSVGAPSIAEYDEDRNFIRRFFVGGSGAGASFTTSPNTYYIRKNMQFTSNYYDEGRLNLGEDQGYEPYRATFKDVKIDENTLEDNSVTEQKVKNNAITSDKRTPLGEMALVTVGKNSKLIDFIPSKRQIVFDGLGFIFHRGKRYRVESGTTIDFMEHVNQSGVVIYFDTLTNDFITTSQTQMYNITENCVLFAIAYDSEARGWRLVINGEYTIDGNPLYMPFDVTEETFFPYRFSAERIGNDFPESDLAGVGEEGNPFNRTNDTHELIYALFDELMEKYPTYITKEEIGQSTNGLPIYAYFFKPERTPVIRGGEYEEYPEIILDSSVHGGENLSTDTLYFLFKRICEEWQTDETLEYLRHYINFSVVPLPNPEDYNNKQYIGLENVNLNRDFDYGWFEREGSGEVVNSRVESVVMQNFFHEHSDALMFVNCHVRGNPVTSDNDLMWMGAGEESEIPILSNVVEKMTRKWKLKYPQLQNVEGQLGYITRAEAAGTIKSYAHRIAGVTSILWEGFKSSPTMNDFEGKDVVDMNVDYLGETILSIVKHYS